MSVLRWIAPFLIVFLAAQAFILQPMVAEIGELEASVDRLKAEYLEKTRQVLNLDALRGQLAEADLALAKVAADLPDGFDPAIADRLSGLARGRGLRVEEIRLAGESTRDFYGWRAVRIKLTGRYHDLGAFAAELDRLPGCLMLQDLSLQPAPGQRQLTMEGYVRVFRYLSEEEVAAQRKKAVKGPKA